MKYPLIIADMTWSHSRLSAFEMCPYKFLMTYIKPVNTKQKKFFSEYGILMHNLLEGFYSGTIPADELSFEFMKGFVRLPIAPKEKTRLNYFSQGLDYLKTFSPIPGNVLGIEEHFDFQIGSYRFTGFSDLITECDGVCVWDHKSRDLKPRSTGGRKIKSDRELDDYLRQLYLYSIPVSEKYGTPDRLCFNCFRVNRQIEEPFIQSDQKKAVDWALSVIHNVEEESDWNPNLDYCRCKFLCDVSHECEYCNMAFGK